MLNSSNVVRFSTRYLFTFLFSFSLSFSNSYAGTDPKEELSREYRARGYKEQQQGNLNTALSYFTKALTLGNESPSIHNDIGIIYEQIGLAAKAHQQYLKAIQLDSGYLPAYTNLAYLYKQYGQQDKAFEYFLLRYQKSDLDDPWLDKVSQELIDIRPSFTNQILKDKAQRLSKELVEQKHLEFTQKVTQAKQHVHQAKTYHKKGNLKEAVRQFDIALTLTPNDPSILEARDSIKLEIARQNIREYSDQAIKMLRSGDPLSAKNEIRKILATIPDNQ